MEIQTVGTLYLKMGSGNGLGKQITNPHDKYFFSDNFVIAFSDQSVLYYIIKITISEHMSYKRIHVRVPIQGEALLLSCKDTSIKAQTIDISHGGVAITSPDVPLTEDTYDIIITFKDRKKIKLAAYLVRQEDGVLGFKTDKIDSDSLQIITDLVFAYQETNDFIKQIDEHNVLGQSFIDEEGKELDITFNVDLEKP